MLKLHVVQADEGDCFVLEYGTPSSPRYILVDGGPADVYEQHLRDRLLDITAGGGKLDLAIVSHVDKDHIVGVLDLMKELRKQGASGATGTIAIDALWHNTFSQTVGREIAYRFRKFMEDSGGLRELMVFSDRAEKGIKEGDALTEVVNGLGIPINHRFKPHRLICADDAPAPVVLGTLSLHVVGPTRRNLGKLKKKWLKWLEEHESPIRVRDPILAEKAARRADGSIHNLSSIMILAEADGRSILLTGDGRNDDLLEGLGQAGLLSPAGTLHVDVLKLPHHGSDRNVDKAFFSKVTADTYVISADGKENPDPDTLKWMVEAARDQGRRIVILVTNEPTFTQEFLQQFDPDQCGYELRIMQPSDDAITLELVP